MAGIDFEVAVSKTLNYHPKFPLAVETLKLVRICTVTYFTGCVCTSLLNWQVTGPARELTKLDSASPCLFATEQTCEMFGLVVAMGVWLVTRSYTHMLIRTPTSVYVFHRIIECSGLEGTFRGHLAQPPCSEQRHLQSDQVAQSAVRPGLKCFQG